jgi:hypothetical protein
VYVPVAIMPACTLGPRLWDFFPYQATFVGCFFLVGLAYRAPLAKIPSLPLSNEFFWGGIILWSLGCLLLVGQTFGFRLRMLSIFDVYDVRAAFKGQLSEVSPIVAYLVGWQAKVITPLVFTYGLRNKRWASVLGAGWFQLLLFCFSGMKTLLFSLLLLLGLHIGLRLSRGQLLRTLLAGITCAVVLCTILDLSMDNFVFSTLFVRRMICTPGLLSIFYYDYFSTRPKMLYGYGALEGLVETPYGESPASLIAHEYFGYEEGSANANVWADAYANLGLEGMVAASVVLGFVLWGYDCLSQRRDRIAASLLLTLPSMALVNTALQTTIASHGLGLAAVLAFLMPAQSAPSEEAPRTLPPRPALKPHRPPAPRPAGQVQAP